MSDHTEALIQQLCAEALAATTEADVERIVPKLQAALHEHIRLARESLEDQVNTFPLIEAASRLVTP